ncbi:hypothetical protein [Stenomitos frigidus]|uniref:DUF928 domain-containing protein n=1 Tax=Stenomitos frigidus ULC18 TaxID=2107698 RepID=A0A2T1DWZ0_9CYAN|nr:hypothetical protein [Stenomitos frigidus]PSB25000.1 hypothetical protein C7B82_24895 [Stenomitos frigidus ULC18]
MTSLILPILYLPANGVPLTESENFLLRGFAQANSQPTSKIGFWQHKPRRPRTIRGNVCPISPGLIETLNIWHDRPLFIWQGQGSQLRVRDYNQRDRVLWERTITDQAPVRYDGQAALQPGQLYQWQIMATDPATPNRLANQKTWETFRVLPAEQRQAIGTALRTLEQRLQQQNASAEDIALIKAEFFADQDLWSDALQVIYEVSNPSAQFVEQRSSYVASLCQSSAP